MYLKSRFLGLSLLILGVAQGPFLHANILIDEGFGGPTLRCDGMTIVHTDDEGTDTGYCFTGGSYAFAVSPYTTAMSLDIFLLTPFLPPNLPLTDITVATDNADAFDGVNVWEGGTMRDISGGSISVGTDGSGQIDQWEILVDGAGPLAGWQLESTWNLTSGSTTITDGLLAQNINDPGSWSQVSPTPEPASGVELALGLLALGALFIGKRRLSTQRA